MKGSSLTLPASLEQFFFEKTSAKGFGLMRIGWSITAFLFYLPNFLSAARYYSNNGLIPQSLGYLEHRSEYRFTLLDTFTGNTSVTILFVILLIALLLVCFGKWTRTALIVSVVLLFSFQERDVLILAGGDTVLRLTGFLLVLNPNPYVHSLDRRRALKKHRKDPFGLTMPIWPYRLLLWQLIVIYISSVWIKMTGEMWADGTAFSAIVHHTHFLRFPREVSDWLTIFSPFVSAFTFVFMLSWLLLLIPKEITGKLPKWIPRIPLKRTILLMGILFHGGIFVLMDVGSFSFAMLTMYLGLLTDDDLRSISAFWKSVNRVVRLR